MTQSRCDLCGGSRKLTTRGGIEIECPRCLQAYIALLTDNRDDYRKQARDYRDSMLASDKRLVDLATQLATMPRTPDGTLVVLGETVLWRRRYGGAILHGVAVGVDVADKTFHAKWHDGDEARYEQTVAMSRCYGSEASLLKAEETNGNT
jgi:hypothetical protein